MNVSFSALFETIAALPALELKAVSLLRQQRAGLPQPDRETVTTATVEMIHYAESCEKSVRALLPLSPVPVSDPALVEDYPL